MFVFKKLPLLLYILPKNLISFITGFLIRLEPPQIISSFLNKIFVWLFNIDMSESDIALEKCKSIEDVFTRPIKKELRPLQGSIISPADGILSYSANPETFDEALQVKGSTYSLKELVFANDKNTPNNFEPLWYSTVYLAPHNYHRVHSPTEGQLLAIDYLPGTLWPVNQRYLNLIPRLFAKNERLVFKIRNDSYGVYYLVMVGAFNVGRMQTHFWPEFATNSFQRQLRIKPEICSKKLDKKINLGDELGVFMLGSTVVLVFVDPRATQALAHVAEATAIKLGQSIAKK